MPSHHKYLIGQCGSLIAQALCGGCRGTHLGTGIAGGLFTANACFFHSYFLELGKLRALVPGHTNPESYR